LPKTLIEQSGIVGKVGIEVQPDGIMIRLIAPHVVRSSWDSAFATMAEVGDDRLLDAPTATEWEQAEWDW
jgi:hypothetical protein